MNQLSAHLRLHRGHPTKTLLKRFRETLPVPERRMTKYSASQLTEPLIHAATKGAYPSQAADELRANGRRVPHKDTLFNRLGQLDGSEVLDWFLTMNKEILEYHRRNGSLTPSAVAIDVHERSFYGKDKTHAIGRKNKDGTSWAHALITLERVKEPRACLSTRPYRQLDNLADSVRTAIEEARCYQRITLVMIDRAAYSTACLETLEELKQPYIVPTPKDPRIKTRIDKARPSAERIKGKKFRAAWAELPLGAAKPTLVILFDESKEKESVFTFVTTMKVNKKNVVQLGRLYRSRWGIETAYRVRKVYHIRTNCLKYALRLLFLLLEVLLYNLWIGLNDSWVGPRPKDRYPVSYHWFRIWLTGSG